MTSTMPPVQGQDPARDPSQPPTLGNAMGASPHDVQTRLEEEHYLQYRRAQHNKIQAANLLQLLEQKVQQQQQEKQEDVPPEDPEDRLIWRHKTFQEGMPTARINRRVQADPDPSMVEEAGRLQFARTTYDDFYERGKNMAAHKLHAGAALSDKLARTIIGAGDDGRLMYDQADLWAMKDRDYQGSPGIEQALSGLTNFSGPESRYPKAIKPGGHEKLLPREKQRDLAFEAMKQGYAETIAKASGSRKAAIQALETIGSTVPYVAAAGALPGGIIGAAATGAAVGAVEPLSGEDKQAVDKAGDQGHKMEAEVRALRGIQGAVSWGLMGLGGKAGVGNTIGGRLKQAAGMHLGSEVGSALGDTTRGVHEAITGKDPGAQSAIGKALVALNDPALSPEQRNQALLEAGTHFGVGFAAFAAVHVATGLREIAPRTMARPENVEAVAKLEKTARAELRQQDVEPDTIATVLPSSEKVAVKVGDRVDTRPPKTGTRAGMADYDTMPGVTTVTVDGKTKRIDNRGIDLTERIKDAEVVGQEGTQEGMAAIGEALPPEPHVTPPGPPQRLSKAEREAMGEALEPGTRFKLHDSVTLGNGGELEVVRNEVGDKGVIQVKDQAGKTIDMTPDMLDLVLPESMREPKTPTPQPRPPAINPTSDATVPAFSRSGKRPESVMEVHAHDAESPWRVRTKEGQRVPVDIEDPGAPVLKGGVTLPDGTRVETHGATMEEFARKLESQLGDRGTMEASGDVGRAVEGAQKEKAVEELKQKRPQPEEDREQIPLRPDQARGEDEPPGDRPPLDPQAGVMLNPAEMLMRLINRDPAKSLKRRYDTIKDQERFLKTPPSHLNETARQLLGGVSEKMGPRAGEIIVKHLMDRNATEDRLANLLYDKKTGAARGVKTGGDLSHDLFVAANAPHDAEGAVRQAEAKARLAAGGHTEALEKAQKMLSWFQRFYARHGPKPERLRRDINELGDDIQQARETMADPTWLAKVPAPLAKFIRAKQEKKVSGWETQHQKMRDALAKRIEEWGVQKDYMHRVWADMKGTTGIQKFHNDVLKKAGGPKAVGFRALKRRMNKEGYVEDFVVSMGHYLHGAVRKIYADRIFRDLDKLMEGTPKSIGKPYADAEGNTVDPLRKIKYGQQYKDGPDLVEVKDIERNDDGDVTGVKVQVVGGGFESEKHPAEWLVPDVARRLTQKRGGWKETAAKAQNYLHESVGNDKFVENYEAFKKEVAQGNKLLQVRTRIDKLERVFNGLKNVFVRTLLQNPLVAVPATAPMNMYQNFSRAWVHIGSRNILRGGRHAAISMKRGTEQAWLIRDSGVAQRHYSMGDLTGETGKLMPREGAAHAVDVANKAWGFVYDQANDFSARSIYLGAYYALRPGGRAHQEGRVSHEEAKSYARGVVEKCTGLYDPLLAPDIVKRPWIRLFTSMKGYTLRQAFQYLPQEAHASMQKDAAGNRDYRGMVRMFASASVFAGAAHMASQIIPQWLLGKDTEGQNVANKLGTSVVDIPGIKQGVEALANTAVGRACSAAADWVEKKTGWRPNLHVLASPYFETGLIDKGPGPSVLEHIYDYLGADSDRKKIVVSEGIAKAFGSRMPWVLREWSQKTANPDGSYRTYNAGSVLEAVAPWTKLTGTVKDRGIREADLWMRRLAGTPMRDIIQRDAVNQARATEEKTKGEHADLNDMILAYRRARRQGNATYDMDNQIRERARALGGMPDMGSIERMEKINETGREGRPMFQGPKEARAEYILSYADMKGHDQQLLRMAIGDLFKEPGGLSRETVEKLRALAR